MYFSILEWKRLCYNYFLVKVFDKISKVGESYED